MKEYSDKKVPLYPSSTKNDQDDRDNKNQGESNMIKEKVIKPVTFKKVRQSAQVKKEYLYSIPNT